MKNLMMICALVLASLTVSAQEKNLLDPEFLQTLPTINVIAIEVDHGPAMAAVQPTAFIRLMYMSCSRVPLEALTEEIGNQLFVAVRPVPNTFDCMGTPKFYEHSLQISSDFQHRVVILNPIQTKTNLKNETEYKIENRFRNRF